MMALGTVMCQGKGPVEVNLAPILHRLGPVLEADRQGRLGRLASKALRDLHRLIKLYLVSVCVLLQARRCQFTH